MFDTAYKRISVQRNSPTQGFPSMIITKHVLKRCLAEANLISELHLSEEEMHRRIKILFLRYELKQLTQDELLEALIAEGIALAEITAEPE